MKKINYVFILVTVFLTATLMYSHNTYAALGGNSASVEADRAHFNATKKSSVSKVGYSIQEIDAGSVTIREYVSTTSDLVFGIAWNGFRNPDLGILLGTYADEYTKVATQKAQIHGQKNSSSVKTSNITVEQWGHMRNLQGRAYMQSQLPEGVQSDEIK